MATPSHSPSTALSRRILRLLTGPLIALITLVIMLGAGELYFRAVLKSDAYDFTLMAKHWKEVCWKPIFTVTSEKWGTFSYRDRTWTDADVQGKTKIMVIGDSFVAGHGICNVKDRFSDVLQTRLGDGYAVFNVAGNGWGTPEETYYPLFYPYQPDIVVLSYFVNDIDNAITLTNHAKPKIVARPDWMENTFLKDSYLVDYVYWQLIYKRQFADSNAALQRNLLDSYFVPDVWAEHKNEIMQVINWAKGIKAPLIVITWPMLDHMEGSAQQLAQVEQVFRDNGATVISAADLFRGEPPEKLVVNNIDSHPNEATHHRMGEELYKVIQSLSKAP